MKIIIVVISEKMFEELRKLGTMNQSFESIIAEILSHVMTCGRYWERKN